MLHFLIRAALMVSYALAIGDCITTGGAIHAGAHEGNPLVAFVMRLLNTKWVLVRLAFALFAAYAGIIQADTPLALVVALAIDAGLCWLVLHNWLLWQDERTAHA